MMKLLEFGKTPCGAMLEKYCENENVRYFIGEQEIGQAEYDALAGLAMA